MELVLTPSQLATFDFSRGVGAVHTPSSENLKETLADLSKVLDSALVAGGMAVIHFGYERNTKDIDVLYADSDEADILKRLKKDFKIVRKSPSGWHHFEHRRTKVRLELVPEGRLTTYGFIPGPKTVGGDAGFVSLLGLVWMKLVSGRSKDDSDLVEVAKLRRDEMNRIAASLPPELRVRYNELLARAQREFQNDPNRDSDDQVDARDKAEESAPAYGSKKRARRKPVAKRER